MKLNEIFAMTVSALLGVIGGNLIGNALLKLYEWIGRHNEKD